MGVIRFSRLSHGARCMFVLAGLAAACGGAQDVVPAGSGSGSDSTAAQPETTSVGGQTAAGSSDSPTSTTDGSTSANGDSSAAAATSSTEDTSAASTGTADTEAGPVEFLAVTFNTGGHANGEDDVADQWYGNGLSWTPAVEQTRAFFDALQPDIVVFQEIFHSPDCVDIPTEFHPGYVCDGWSEGDPTVAQLILGDDYQIACHLGKTDKCAAVKTSFGSFAGCDSDYCLEGLAGGTVDGCGNGSRVGRGVIELVGGGELTVVNFHGTSGILPEDQACRVEQVNQVFLDLDGSGQPGAGGERNLVLGDFNTDPARSVLFDFSAQRWNDFVGADHPFHFITDVGTEALPTYAGIANIDHQVSDTFEGACWHPGITPGYEPVVDFSYFDHVPAVCQLSAAR